ncbi:hypothetical protein B0T44_06365 [Nocardia donostiensis]|uniref:Uncharacterized protein n=1 Tax=Nocardia donostiensis TaxID=1538463 RepID=A0A1V2TJZ8_9NOCA|nr:hypothetical protein B0T46_05165 [Nocardia donostiensis]OQS12663.1 hypothetical protein B0T36_23490 [Nocardia donostiensis]OQS22246.1 hypothetical protein B0T44_06365 [Nocardia donostiensis]
MRATFHGHVICSTKVIETLSARYQRAIRARSHFPSEQVAGMAPRGKAKRRAQQYLVGAPPAVTEANGANIAGLAWLLLS